MQPPRPGGMPPYMMQPGPGQGTAGPTPTQTGGGQTPPGLMGAAGPMGLMGSAPTMEMGPMGQMRLEMQQQSQAIRAGIQRLNLPEAVKRRALSAFNTRLSATSSIEQAIRAANRAIPGRSQDIPLTKADGIITKRRGPDGVMREVY